MREGQAALAELMRAALTRLLRLGPRAASTSAALFTVEEHAGLTELLAALTATAELLGRAQVRSQIADLRLQIADLRLQGEADHRHAALRQSEIANRQSAMLRVPVRRQSDSWKCGASALEAVLAFYGIEVNAEELVRQLGTDPRAGTRPREIIAVARQHGLEVSEASGLGLDALAGFLAQGKPVLAPIQRHGGGHWVVVAGLEEKWVYLMDPAVGADRMSREDFAAAWHDTDADGRSYPRYALVLARPTFTESLRRLVEVRGPPAPAPLTPERALEYFLGLLPELGVNPQRFGPAHRRRAFTLAVATERELLVRVQDFLAERLRGGQVSPAVEDLEELLDAAGVSHRNPAYAELVVRTNLADAYHAGAWEEFSDPDVQETFPVWQYSNPVDSRSRPHHAAKDGNYYPASVPFVQVRGTGIADVANCRCTFLPIFYADWKELKAHGARIAAGYPDVPA